MKRVMHFVISVLALIWLATVMAAGYGIRTIWIHELTRAAKRAEEHHESIRALHEFYRHALEQIGNTVHYGQPTRIAPETHLVADAELALRHAVHEDTLTNGMTALRREYDAMGQHPSDDELRDEVESLILGHTPTNLGVRDGAR
ncbi:MAG: hypothetical protein ACRDQZ_13135 [Mycobacteriales bacterium]